MNTAAAADRKARRARRRVAKKRRLAKLSRRRRVVRRVGIAGTWLLALLTVCVVAFAFLFYRLSNVPKPSSLPLPQVATIEYSDGSVLARIGTVNRTVVALDQVPEAVRWAVIAAEDRSFYSDPGFSIKGTLRAAWDDVTGGYTQGGSGITQQYAKNAYLSDEKTLSRKLKELMISIKLAREYSKDQILDFYLNTVYFGRGAYGIQAAAQTFFGVDVDKLDAAQGAVLASLLRAPSYYDPANNPAAAHTRWQYVINGMVAIGKLTQARADALTYPTVLAPTDSGLGATGWKQFVVYQVQRELEAHGIDEAEINGRGLVIRTTIDKRAQSAALTAIRTAFAHLTPKQRNLKNALVAVAPKTGAVLAYYGGPNGPGYNGKVDNFDYAGIGTRPPGSSFKPYVLATVLTQTLDRTSGKPRLSIDSRVNGSYCVTIEGRKICNDPGDRPVSGPSVTIANAMKYSLNTTFDLLAAQAGPDDVAAMAHRMGIPETDSDGNRLLVGPDGHTGFGIGIGDYPVSPLDQAVGYATLANGGVSNPAYFVQWAKDSAGQVVYRHQSNAQRVLDAKVANDVTLTLEPIASYSGFGLADGRPNAAKTGTEGIFEDPDGNDSDAWTVGFTPQVSAAVWTGSGNSTTPIYNANGLPEYGADLPGTTWKLFMDAYLSGRAPAPMPTTQQITGGQDTARVPSTHPATRTATPSTSAPASPTAPPSRPGPPEPTGSPSATPSPTATATTSGPPPQSPAPTPGGVASRAAVGAGPPG